MKGRPVANEENKSGEQKAAESEVETFQSDLGPFVVAAETTRMPMVFTNAKEPGHRIIFANDSFLALTGYTRKEVLGEPFNSLTAPGADPTALSQIELAFEGKSDTDPEISRARSRDRSRRAPCRAQGYGYADCRCSNGRRRTSPVSCRDRVRPRA